MRFELIHYQNGDGSADGRDCPNRSPGLMEWWWEYLIAQIKNRHRGNRLPEAGFTSPST